MLSTLMSHTQRILIPSTTYKTSDSPLNLKNPWSKVDEDPPIICTPATFPVRATFKSTCLLSEITSPATVCCE